jgi:hypothetical protein
MNQTIHLPQTVQLAIAAVVLIAFSQTFAFAQEVDDAESHSQEAWREAIAQTEVPAEGCFHASYPSLTWNEVECILTPNIPIGPPDEHISQTVGVGNDYAARVTSGQITETVGSFPKATGVKKETGLFGANSYTLQINSNIMTTVACSGAADPAKCRGWQQFIYASSEGGTAYMQYWLLGWNNACPNGWTSWVGSPDCYTNSAAVNLPSAAIGELKTLKLAGSATKGDKDTLVMTIGTEAYSTAGSDSVLDLATDWEKSEFNIVGDGGEAYFNKGSSITVKVAVSNGTANAPECLSHAGTTGESNNLNLSSCSSTGGTAPYIEFSESN